MLYFGESLLQAAERMKSCLTVLVEIPVKINNASEVYHLGVFVLKCVHTECIIIKMLYYHLASVPMQK